MIMTWRRITSLLFMAIVISLSSCADEKKPIVQVKNTEEKSQAVTGQPVKLQQIADQGSQGSFVAGTDYYLLNQPLEPETSQGIEVLEIFWYGCPHCYATQPYIRQWLQNKPDNATFVSMPAALSGLWSLHAQIFYTNQALGLEEKLHQATFDAIHKLQLRMTSVEQFAQYYQENFGIDPEKYQQTFQSFSVTVKLKKAANKIKQAAVSSVPSFIVAGKYLVNNQSAGSTARIFQIINYLVEMES